MKNLKFCEIGVFFHYYFLVIGAQKLDSRLVGGAPVEDGDFPFMVSIRFRNMHHCGGTILNERHILTAAHCVDMLVNHTKLLSVQYGTAHTTNLVNVINVTNIILHESWDVNTDGYYNDIAILKLKDAIPSHYLQILELAEENEPIQDLETIELLGWGRTESGGSGSTQLRYTQVVLFPNYYCQYFVPVYNSEFQFCGGIIKGGAGQCGGDSGGPAIINGKQFGIISWSKKPCASPGNPGIFVRIPKYRAFIDRYDEF